MSQQQAIALIGPRRIGEDDANVSAQRRPGPVFHVFQKWCNKESPLTPNARHVLLQIARRMQADGKGREVAFVGERRLVEDSGLSQSTVRRAVRELREAGAITASPGGVTRGHAHRCNGFDLID